MAYSKSSGKAVDRYCKKNYDDIRVRVKKGQNEVIQAHVQKTGESVNGFIGRAIEETMLRDQEKAEK